MSASSRHVWTSLVYGVLIGCSAFLAAAQQPRSPQMPAPPPMRFVSRDERAELSASRDSKSRLRRSIELAEQHLNQAENFTSQKKFDQASEEIGHYLGLIDDARQLLAGMNHDKNNTRDLYRHLDTALRKEVPRLAVMRRTTPAEYALNIKAAEEYVRDTREEALDSFYGHTVLRDRGDNEKKPDKSKDAPPENKRP